MKVVIVGGITGGAAAATRLRRLDENMHIVTVERTPYVSYKASGLPYYLGNVIVGEQKIKSDNLSTPRGRFDLDVRVSSEVVAIDRENKTVTIHDLVEDNEYTETYDKLLLSPGAKPLIPEVPGADSKKIFTIRDADDALAINNYFATVHPSHAVVLGGNSLAIEMTENLYQAGLDIVMLQDQGQILTNFDEDMALMAQAELEKNEIDIRLNAQTTKFEDTEKGITVSYLDKVANEEKTVETEMVVLCLGAKPESELAEKAGLELGVNNTIKVDEHMCTTDPDIYAVGDAVQVKNFITGKYQPGAQAGPANRQARIAANNIVGQLDEYHGAQNTGITKVFDIAVGRTGLTLAQAQAAGFDCDYFLAPIAAHYPIYPGGGRIYYKVIFEKPSGRILGAQVSGPQTVDKRIDVFATAIRAKMTAADLADIDFAFAPPYNTPKDPANMAGIAIQDLLEGKFEQTHWLNIDEREEGAVIVDLSMKKEFDKGHHPDAINIPLEELREHLDELPLDKTVYTCCRMGLRGYIGYRILLQKGYKPMNLAGGFFYYEAMGQETVTEEE